MAAPPADRAARRPVASLLLGLSLDRAADAPPLYQQIRDRVEAAVLGGSLGQGMRLPPERSLATALGVNRSTVMQAYQELAASGLVEGRPGRGTVVMGPYRGPGADSPGDPSPSPDLSWLLSLPPLGQGSLGPDPSLLRDLAAISARPEIISLAAGAPGQDLIPSSAIQAALEDGLRLRGPCALSYGPVEGHTWLRHALAERLRGRGLPVEEDEILVLSGATQGIALAAQSLIERGDTVVVEAPTYIGVLQTFAAAGARLLPIPVDENGMRVDLLAPLLGRVRPRLIVVQPNLHNPTNTTMSPDRRERLLGLARRHGIPILEDEAYAELWFHGGGPPPLKSLDRDGLVLYLGTASKTLAPGLRIGWLAASAPVVARLTLAKQFADLQSNSMAQMALCRMLMDGAYDRHLAEVRIAYRARSLALSGAVSALPGTRIFPGSPGGFYLWCGLPLGMSSRMVTLAAARAGVAVVAGEAFYPPEGPSPADGRARLRLSWASHQPARLVEGVARLAPILQEATVPAGEVRISSLPVV
ncbi:MAG TPA: PLP-dependent aminotransferase family protein [Chloroflexota bacterium]|nr:PLP-dependent aminotransferase family protein [Chloroflexota bacterium]